MDTLPHTAQLLYAQLMESLRAQSIPQTRGLSFVSKQIKDNRYWYAQYTIGSKKQQTYMGPDSEQLRHLMASFETSLEEIAPLAEHTSGLVRMLKQSRCYSPLKGEFRVLQMLDLMGYFKAGGILVGSHAFFSYANMLGVSFEGEDLRTSDIDLVPDSPIMLALPEDQEEFGQRVLASGYGFFEIPKLNNKHPSTSYMSRKENIKLDLVTPLIGKPSSKPVYIASINGYAEPVRFLDYLLEDVQQAAIIEGSGILINIPHPARYAIHKLVVAERRPASDTLKKRKDIRQAELLLSILLDEDTYSVELAVEAAQAMPAKFMTQVHRGLGKLQPDIKERLSAIINSPSSN